MEVSYLFNWSLINCNLLLGQKYIRNNLESTQGTLSACYVRSVELKTINHSTNLLLTHLKLSLFALYGTNNVHDYCIDITYSDFILE